MAKYIILPGHNYEGYGDPIISFESKEDCFTYIKKQNKYDADYWGVFDTDTLDEIRQPK